MVAAPVTRQFIQQPIDIDRPGCTRRCAYKKALRPWSLGPRLLIRLPLKELCQLPYFPHQGQEEVPRLVELVPVSFSSKLGVEAADVLERWFRAEP